MSGGVVLAGDGLGGLLRNSLVNSPDLAYFLRAHGATLDSGIYSFLEVFDHLGVQLLLVGIKFGTDLFAGDLAGLEVCDELLLVVGIGVR